MTGQLDDMTPPDAFAGVGALIELITHPQACRKRLEKLQRVEATIKRESVELAAARADYDHNAAQTLDRMQKLESSCQRLGIQAFSKVKELKRMLQEYRETGELQPLHENFETESAELSVESDRISEALAAGMR